MLRSISTLDWTFYKLSANQSANNYLYRVGPRSILQIRLWRITIACSPCHPSPTHSQTSASARSSLTYERRPSSSSPYDSSPASWSWAQRPKEPQKGLVHPGWRPCPERIAGCRSQSSFWSRPCKVHRRCPGQAKYTYTLESIITALKKLRQQGKTNKYFPRAGGDSCSKGCEFESRHHILEGHFFTFICCKNRAVCLKILK